MSLIASTPRSEQRHSQPPRETRCLTVGPWQTREFAIALNKIDSLRIAPAALTVDAAARQIEAFDVPPELVLVAQSLPGDVSQHEVNRLQRLAPLARIVIVAGTWCEGELRTGHPPTGAIRLYWYELPSWWRANQRRLGLGLAPNWSAPLDHPLACRYAPTSLPVNLPQVAIRSDDFAIYECFADAGIPSIWTRDEEFPTAEAGIFDAGQLSVRELKRLADFCQNIAGPVVALVDFPRAEHFALAREAGAAAVFTKPYIIEEVCAELCAPPGIAQSPHF